MVFQRKDKIYGDIKFIDILLQNIPYNNCVIIMDRNESKGSLKGNDHEIAINKVN